MSLPTLGSTKIEKELLPLFFDKILNMSSWHVFQNAAGNLDILQVKPQESLTLKMVQSTCLARTGGQTSYCEA